MLGGGRGAWTLAVLLLAACRPAAPGAEVLTQAVLERDPVQAQALLARGAPADARVGSGPHAGKSVLMLAAQRGDAGLARALLDAGADPDIDNGRGGTALMFAATHDHREVAGLLLAAGADPDRQADNGWTALMLATAKGHGEMVGLLVAAGADPDLADVYGWTPLMRAAEQGDTALMAQLQALGADPERRNQHGLDAAAIAAAATVAQQRRMLPE